MIKLSFSAPSLRWHLNVKQCELSSVQDNADEPLVRRGDTDGISEVHFLSLILYLGDFIGKTNLHLLLALSL